MHRHPDPARYVSPPHGGFRAHPAAGGNLGARGRGPAALIRRHPLASFVVLAYGISWITWLPYILSLNGEGILRFTFPAPIGSGSQELVGILPGAYLGPLFSAFLVTAVTQGKAGLRVWRARLFHWRVGGRWYAFALLGIPALLVLGLLPLAPVHSFSLTLPLAYATQLIGQMIFTGVAEEPGWRDFALPRLQSRYGPLPGTLILAAVWTGWHIPLFFTDWASGFGGGSLPSFALFALTGLVLSIIITWTFNHTNESLPVAMLVHVSYNTFLSVASPAIFPSLGSLEGLTAPLIGLGALAVVIVIRTRGRLGYRAPAGTRRASGGRGSRSLSRPGTGGRDRERG
ncbi:MAG: CPBP family intramembrane glutamic endopeptidase [Trebonia sp.]